MTRPLDPANIDHAIELYLAGKSLQQIKAATGVTTNALWRHRTRRGIPPRREHRISVSVENIVDSYLAGESELRLSQRYEVSREVIRRRLLEENIEIRSWEEAGRTRARRMTPEQRKAQATAAHEALGGSHRSYESLVTAAQTRERKGLCGSPGERFVYNALLYANLGPVPQKAIGKYNVDIAVAPVAVEVLGGSWHLAKRHHVVRTPYILDQGWSLLFVWNYEGRSTLTREGTDYVVAYCHEVRGHPTLVGEYRVIAGNGELLARGRLEGDQFTLVPPPRGRLDTRPRHRRPGG